MRKRRAFTLVELVLAVGLFSILILALVRLVDTSLSIWGRTEENRELFEIGGGVLELLAGDVQAVEGGPRGDLVGDWTLFDVDRDQIAGLPWPRLRLVRHVSPAELALLSAAGGANASDERPARAGLVEVCWALLPDPAASADERPLGVLWRGERVRGDPGTLSFFDEGFFGAGGKPVPGALHAVSGGVLWLDVWYATQTSVVHDGWSLGEELSDCSASWDAWNRGRPNAERTFLNRAPAGMPQAKDLPILPRRIRIELELERPEDLKFRTRLAAELGADAGQLEVRDGRRLPPRDAHVLVGEEWMRVLSVDGERISVERARRGTRAVAHPRDALVHHGWPIAREIPLAMTREDWDL
jgi:hypothetical protein